MKETIVLNSLDKERRELIKNKESMLDLKLQIQDLEEDLDYFKEQWREMGAIVKSYAQAREMMIQELLRRIN